MKKFVQINNKKYYNAANTQSLSILIKIEW